MTGPRIEMIPGLEGYAVSEDGAVLSCRRSGRWVVLKQERHNSGYLRVSVQDGLRRRHRFVHHLVLSAFVGARPEGMETRHLNGDRTDNRAVNLAWGTRRENNADQDQHGTRIKCERHHQAKLTPMQLAQAIKLRAEGVTARQTCEALSLSVAPSTLRRAIAGKTWRDANVERRAASRPVLSGAAAPRATIAAETAVEIWRACASGRTAVDVAREFGVSVFVVYGIKQGRTFRREIAARDGHGARRTP